MCHGKYCAKKIQNTCAFKMQRCRLFNPFSLHTCTQYIAVEKEQKGTLRTILSYSTQPSKHGRDQLQQLYSHEFQVFLRISTGLYSGGHLSIYNHVRPGLSWNSVVKGNTITASTAPTALVIGCHIAHRGARGKCGGVTQYLTLIIQYLHSFSQTVVYSWSRVKNIFGQIFFQYRPSNRYQPG